MNINSLLPKVKEEILKPFSEKFERTKQLIKLFSKVPNACVSCSFGKDSMAVLKLVLEENPNIPVIFNDTLIEFPETLKLKNRIVKEWNLNFFETRPEKGVNFWTINDRIIKEGLKMDDGRKRSNICCYHLKKKPFAIWRKLNNITSSFTGITAVESRHRMFTACQKGMEYYSFGDGLRKIHPIIWWTEEEVWKFIKENSIPVNEAYAKYGINRIGCMWCMSYKNWRKNVAKINPKVYEYMLTRYKGYKRTESLLDL